MRESPEVEHRKNMIKSCPSCTNYSYREPLSIKHTVFNAAAFQGAWLDLLVFHSGLAMLFIGLLGLQLWRLFNAHFRYLFIPLIAIFSSGLMIDSLFSFFQLFSFSESTMLASVIPPWLVLLWLAFVMSLPISFSWLLLKPSLAVGVFACMAPLSYIAGRHIGVIDFSNGTILLISLAWGVVAYLSCRWVGAVVSEKVDLASDLDD